MKAPFACMSEWASPIAAISPPTYGSCAPDSSLKKAPSVSLRSVPMAWFTRQKSGVEGGGDGEKKVRTEGLWLKCESCGQIIWKKALDENFQVCPRCDFHNRVDARTRLGELFDG